MIAYLARRLAFAGFLIVSVSSASFVLARLAPGDYVSTALGIEARRETIQQARARYGLDKPIAEQYRDWISRAIRFDFGHSLLYDRPVRDIVPERAANSAVLAVTGLLLATVIGLPLGVVSATGRRRLLAGSIRWCSVLFLSAPPLLTSLALVFIAARTGWFPVSGMRSAAVQGTTGTIDLLHHLILPSCALALPLAALFERLQSQAMTEVMDQPFVLATRGRGVSRSRLVWRDALKAALRPIASVYGLAVGALLSGSFVVEVITAWPGLGSLMLDALRARDVFLVAGGAAAGALFLAFGTLVSDLALAAIDPRSRE